MSTNPPQQHAWTYDPRLNNGRGAYRDTVTGRIISHAQAVEYIDIAIDRTTDGVLARLNILLFDKQISVNDWASQFAQTIKDAYIQQAELAAGGRAQMTQQYWGVVGGTLREQYGWLSKFVREIADGKLSPAQIQMRSQMYINSAREAYWRISDLKAKERGYTQERWVTMGDNAVCDPCVEAGAMGWVALGVLAQPGSGYVLRNPPTACKGLVNCRCRKEYK